MNRPGEISVSAAIKPLKTAFLVLGILSGLVNILALTGSMYMLQVYDRVLPSRSVPTLVGLTLVMLLLFAAHGALDFIRTRIMARVGLRVEAALRNRVFDTVMLLPLRAAPDANPGTQPIRDLDQIRTYLSGLGPTALFDLPWLPMFVILLWLLHPWLGWFGLGSALILIALTILTEIRTAAPTKASAVSGFQRASIAESARRNAEVIRAMGMGKRMRESWDISNGRFLTDQLATADASSGIGTLAKIFRMVMQSAMLGLGAWLAVRGEISAGGIIAGTILLGRALAPVELTIAHWKGLVGARHGYQRLKLLLDKVHDDDGRMDLPRPSRAITIDGLTVAAPGQPKPIIQNVNFALKAGDGLGVIGPSASGKSTLARALVGAWLPMARGGQVRLDGATLDQYPPDALGRDIGYLPQAIELFDGTIAQNIARMEPDAPAEAIIEAAKIAGCHEMILQLPEGYNTRTGESGSMLSAGQRQRIALARALYGNPFLVVLDEPNSNLDAIGDFALTQAIRSIRSRGGIVIVVAHRPSALAGVDLLLAMVNGQVHAFGPKDEVLAKVTAPDPNAPRSAARPPAPKVVSTGSYGMRG